MSTRIKKPLYLSFMILLVLILAACSNQSTNNSNSTPSESNNQVQPNNEPQPAKDTFPERQVTLVATHAAGGTVDVVARGIQPYLQKYLGVPVVVENRDGAGGKIARTEVFKADPDGHTLLVSLAPSLQVGELVEGGEYKSMEYSYVYNWYGKDAFVLVVKKDSPYASLQEIIDASASKTIKIGGAGRGTAAQLESLVLQEIANLTHTYVPYESGAAAIAALLGGEVDAVATPGLSVAKQDEIKALVANSRERLESLPDVPTFGELGFEGGIVPSLGGAFGPPGIPEERLKILQEAFEKAVNDPEYIDWANKASFGLEPLNGDEFYQVSKELYDTVEAFAEKLK